MKKINDLRSALECLAAISGELLETDVAVDPDAEISGVYRHVGAMGVIQRPTRLGPAMVFNNVTGFPGARVAIGVLSSRKRVGHILGCEPEKLGFLLRDSVNNRIKPVDAAPEEILCQEVVHLAADPGFDIRKLVPAPRNTPEDAGPYITMGHCYSHDPITGDHDVTIHRLCLQDEDTMTFNSAPGRHLDVFRRKWEGQGKPMPMSVSIGIDPAIPIACCFEAPTTPLGLDELSIAGALRKEPVKLAQCLTVDQKCIANAEYVLECEILPNVTMPENPNPDSGGWAMPEFPGYEGIAHRESAVVKVKAVTMRKNPIMQTCIGPSEEHVNMAGIPTEASILEMTGKALPGFVTNVYATRSGGGKSMVIIQVKKTRPVDQGRERQAALLAFAAYHELKHIILVDDDIDIFDTDDVLWAMNYRFSADKDIIMIPETICHPLDPSENQEYTGYARTGLACKTIFDCTMPFALRDRLFHRARFLDIDPTPFAPELFK
jgi:4-hydroxy-3-polyprenylbenzoate decarboxylase